MQFSWTSYTILPPFQAFFCFVLILFVLKGHFKQTTHRLFAIYLTGIMSWAILIFFMRTSLTSEQSLAYERWVLAIGPLSATFLLHFTIRLLNISIPKWILQAIYAISTFLFAASLLGLVVIDMQRKPYGWAPVAGPLFILTSIIGFGVLLAAAVFLWRARVHALTRESRNRSTYIFIGLIVSIIGLAFDALPLLGLPLYPGFIIGNIIFCFLTTIAIVNYQLLDIQIIIRKGLPYTIITGVAVVFSVLLIVLIQTAIRSGELSTSLLIAIIVIISLLLLPSFRLIQGLVNRWFYWTRYDYLKSLEKFSEESNSIIDLNTLSSSLVSLVTLAIQAETVYLLLPDLSNQKFFAHNISKNNDFSIDFRSPIVQWLTHNKGFLNVKDFDVIPQMRALTRDEETRIDNTKVMIFVPLRVMDKLTGIIVLGQKKDNKFYSDDDFRLLRVVSGQTAASIENARNYMIEKERLVELEKAAQMKANFITVVSHQLKTPLTSIKVAMDLLN